MKVLSSFLLVLFAVSVNAYWTELLKNKYLNAHSRSKRQVLNTIQIHRLKVTASIVARFADTEVVSEIENVDNEPQEIVFQTQIPKTALVSNFSMIIDGKEYVALLKEKEDAESAFEGPDSLGMSAGLEQTQQRETQWFKASVIVEPSDSVVFKLRYQQMLERKLGRYEQIVLADPGMTNVGQFSVKILISEPTGIKDLEALQPFTGTTINSPQDGDFSLVVRKSKTQASISYFKSNYNPMKSDSGRRFVVRYDVEHPNVAGDLWRHNGYFVHFFAPNLESLAKRVVFVVDRSGSMFGSKMTQTKTALTTIMRQLNNNDLFNIISFASDVTEWSDNLERTDELEDALDHVNGLVATGGTNFNAGLEKAILMLDTLGKYTDDDVIMTSIIIVLTDGQPTSGVTNLESIKQNIRKKNKNQYPIFALGFGNDADHDFLIQIALEHQGANRKIYAESDAANQLEGFFSEVANPLLMKLQITYDGKVESVTKNNYLNYFKGSEVIVMGKYDTGNETDSEIIGNVNAIGSNGNFSKSIPSIKLEDEFGSPVSFEVSTDFDVFFERMWAYLTVSQLINDEIIARDETKIEHLQQNIVQTSLQYNYATPFNVMVAQKPQGQNNQGNVYQSTKKPSTQGGQSSFRAPNTFSNTNFQSPYQQSPYQQNTFYGGSPYGNIAPKTTVKTTTEKTTTTIATTRATTTMAPTTSPSLGEVPTNPNEYIADCGFERSIKTKVVLKSPGLVYAANNTCKWTINNNQHNKSMELVFKQLDLEDDFNCKFDRVVVYVDVNEAEPSQFKTFCGFNGVKNLSLTANNNFVVVFQSDMQVQGRGFRAVVSIK